MFSKILHRFNIKRPKIRYVRISLPLMIINAVATIIVFAILILIIDDRYRYSENELVREKLALLWGEVMQDDEDIVKKISTRYQRDSAISSRPYGVRIASRKNITLFLDYPYEWNKLSLKSSDFDRVKLTPSSDAYRLKIGVNGRSYNTNIEVHTLFVKGHYLQVFISLEERANFMRQIFEIAMLSIVLIMILSFFLVNLVLSRILQPLSNMNSVVEDIIYRKKISNRLSGAKKGEFSRLQENFNIMLGQNEKQVMQLKQAAINIGHDIRTPLTRLRNQLEEIVVSRKLPETEQEKVEQGILFIDDIKYLSNQILDLSEIETGALPVPDEAINVKETLLPVVEVFNILAEEKQIMFFSQIDKDCKLFVNTTRLRQIISNLLDNAIKFTPAGKKIVLKIYKNNKHIVCEIIDEGVGIKEEYLALIFRHAWRLDTEDYNGAAGSGFGLTIVESIVTAYHGNIRVESEEGKGTKFVIEFKL